MMSKLWKYSQVRIYTGTVYVSMLLFFTEVVGIWYLFSMVMAFIPSYALEFFLNSRWTYKPRPFNTKITDDEAWYE